MNLDYFKEQDKFYKGLQTLFHSLNIPVNYIDDKLLRPQDILSKTYKDTNPVYQLMNDVYILGMVDDKAFSSSKSADISEIKNKKKGYDGILIFGVTLIDRKNGLLPTRTQLAEVTRAFNREFYYTPVAVVFRYDNFISLANAERQKYKQEWREGEKAGKVSILRDIEIENPHTGHLKILEELKITRSGKKGINSFEGLYQYWQEVFSVNLLNKKFYSELSNWYFWAIKHVKFPTESQYIDDKNQQYKAQSVIRLLTRLLFVWFIKEKKLIPEDLFDLETLQKNILKKISPSNEEATLFKESIYYKAILQNLFFATLNCPVKPDSTDARERGFRGDESYGKHRGVDYLMRYKKYFKDPDAFLEMVNKVVPFLNGGLFECLDDKDKKIYIDGFSDNMSKTDGVANNLVVPDYLFFGSEEKTDLSADYGTKNKGTREAAVKGLINILKSYKFIIAENTPIEEDVALDPELLGKVFENLLASYNPETKTTARKQTGSFYTPREIVNYMVDESLIAHLKNSVSNWDMDEKELDEKLHQLVSFELVNPFENNTELSQEIIHSLDNCKILDPACGSGAFPMGILQKMVHILQKVDPDNEYWQKLQMEKAEKATKGVFAIKDKEERKQLLDEINEAFDETINNPDYARKLFLIENCIYGVDIQPIAAQISKLRFFISLVVEQKVNKDKDNFGVRPLPNLETKFVTANTLIGIDKPDGELFYTKEVQEKEAELKAIRHKLFGAKTKATKVKYRKKDEELRNEIADILKKGNFPVESAEQLAGWDPYDQNGVSPFFDPEWMFNIKDGFDVVIGNPPYVRADSPAIADLRKLIMKSNQYITLWEKWDLMVPFFEKSLRILKDEGVNTFIASNSITTSKFAYKLQNWIIENFRVKSIDYFEDNMQIFEAGVVPVVLIIQKTKKTINPQKIFRKKEFSTIDKIQELDLNGNDLKNLKEKIFKKSFRNFFDYEIETELLGNICYISYGLRPNSDERYWKGEFSKHDVISAFESEVFNKAYIEGKNLKAYKIEHLQFLEWGTERVPKKLVRPTFPELYTGEKLLCGIMTRGTYDNTGVLCNHSIVVLKRFVDLKKVNNRSIFASISKNNIDKKGGKTKTQIVDRKNELEKISMGYSLKYLLAVINSKQAIAHLNNFRKCRLKNYFYPDDFRNYPIPKISYKKQTVFIFLVDCIFFAKGTNFETDTKIFESVIDAIVFNLYFPDHMKERKIDVLQFVEKDIENVMQGKEFETLNDTQKEQVITELQTRWSDSDSEIVKRMNSFSEKSPEILKPILEG